MVGDIEILESKQLAEIEQILNSSFRLLEPRQDFVSNLNLRLNMAYQRKAHNRKVFEYVLLTIFGFVGTAVFLVTSIRAIVLILGLLGILQASRKQKT